MGAALPTCGHARPPDPAGGGGADAAAGGGGGGAAAAEALVQDVSRHRARFAPPKSTPDGNWNAWTFD